MKCAWIALIATGLTSSAAADILLVNADGTGDYPTIQAAIDAAVDGDEVHLTDGTYTGEGNRDIRYNGKAITIRSETGNSDDVSICPECDESYPFHTFIFDGGEGSGSRLEGVSIAGYHTESVMMGSVECLGSSPTFYRCDFSAIGTALYSEGGVPMFDSCEFFGTYSTTGSALLATEATLINCTFSSNHSESSAGAARIGRAFIYGCVFQGNGAYEGCGSLWIGPGSVIEDTSISGSGGMWSGVICASAPVTFRRGSITSTSSQDPKALYVDSGCVTIQDTEIANEDIDGCALRIKSLPVDSSQVLTPTSVEAKSWGKIKEMYR